MLKILVVDDQQAQRDHATKVLSEHELTVAKDWNEAKELIKDGKWDMVLTDLSMPGLEDGQGRDGDKFIGAPTPYGYPIALFALKHKIPKVAVVSNGQADANHHTHPIYWAGDSINGTIIPEKLWVFSGYGCPHMSEETLPGVKSPWDIKDWAKVVKILNGEEKHPNDWDDEDED